MILMFCSCEGIIIILFFPSLTFQTLRKSTWREKKKDCPLLHCHKFDERRCSTSWISQMETHRLFWRGGGEIDVISYLFSFFCSLCVLLGFYRCHYFAFECENLLIRRIFKKLKLAQNFVIFRNNLDNNDKKNIEALFFKYVHEWNV